ncbi:MAG TPA: glutathione synthase [Myxococcaceae bacterium]|nr:glutathione synthase [Myxococcaceae bacterium]
MDRAPLAIGFLMDPLEAVLVHHDTTFALMRSAQVRGHRLLSFGQEALFHAGGQVHARAREVEVFEQQGHHFRVVAEREVPLGVLDVLWMRKDPPVDVAFLHSTQLVEATGGRVPVYVNSPSGLRTANEKLWALHFPELTPETLVSRDLAQLRAFIDDAPDGAIVKPVDGYGGQGVVLLRRGDRNAPSVLELLTARGRDWVVAQTYLPAAREGDKRILLLDGEPLGAINRIPLETENRANMAVGGQPVKSELTRRDREICARLAPTLRREGLVFVGIDVIGGFLIEVNVTSPTGLAELARLDGGDPAGQILAHVERLAADRQGGSPVQGSTSGVGTGR